MFAAGSIIVAAVGGCGAQPLPSIQLATLPAMADQSGGDGAAASAAALAAATSARASPLDGGINEGTHRQQPSLTAAAAATGSTGDPPEQPLEDGAQEQEGEGEQGEQQQGEQQQGEEEEEAQEMRFDDRPGELLTDTELKAAFLDVAGKSCPPLQPRTRNFVVKKYNRALQARMSDLGLGVLLDIRPASAMDEEELKAALGVLKPGFNCPPFRFRKQIEKKHARLLAEEFEARGWGVPPGGGGGGGGGAAVAPGSPVAATAPRTPQGRILRTPRASDTPGTPRTGSKPGSTNSMSIEHAKAHIAGCGGNKPGCPTCDGIFKAAVCEGDVERYTLLVRLKPVYLVLFRQDLKSYKADANEQYGTHGNRETDYTRDARNIPYVYFNLDTNDSLSAKLKQRGHKGKTQMSRMNAMHLAAEKNQPASIKAIANELQRFVCTKLSESLAAYWTGAPESVRGAAKESASLGSGPPPNEMFAAFLQSSEASQEVQWAAASKHGQTLQTAHAEMLRNYLARYLNDPDHVGEKKAANTPLHIACRKGHLGVVAELVSFGPALKVEHLNHDGKRALDLVGTGCPPSVDPRTGRPWGNAADGPTHEEREAVYAEIRELLQPRYFVPLVAPVDSMLPEVAGVWSPDVGAKPSSPIIALAGPMTYGAAEEYRQSWLKPSRSSPRRAEIKARKGIDVQRGFQQQGRATSRQHGVRWEEHWGFLGRLCDLSTLEGLQLLEDHLASSGGGGGGASRYVDGDAPSPSDVDAFVAARTADGLAAALAAKSGDGAWAPGTTTMPNVWKWAQTMHKALGDQKKWDQEHLPPSSPRIGVPKEILQDIVAEANLKKRYADMLARVQSSSVGARPSSAAGGPRGTSRSDGGARGSPLSGYASPLSPRHLRTPSSGTPRTPGSRRVAESCSPLSACSQLNACGCSVLCRCTTSGGGGGGSGGGGTPSRLLPSRLFTGGAGGGGGGGSSASPLRGGEASPRSGGSSSSPLAAGSPGNGAGGGSMLSRGIGSPMAGGMRSPHVLAGSTPHRRPSQRASGLGGSSLSGLSSGVTSFATPAAQRGGGDGPYEYETPAGFATPYATPAAASAAATPYGTPLATPAPSSTTPPPSPPRGSGEQ